LLDRLLTQGLTNPPDDLSAHATLLSEGATRRLQTGDSALAETMLWEAISHFGSLGDVRSRAVTMGQIADILGARGDLDEALRIRHEEELPVYERLGDVYLRAVKMGQIADILGERGDLDEALRIRCEEQLPVFERLGDVRERAVTMGKIADILGKRGDLDEALRIRREEELPVYEHLGELREHAMTMGKIADILEARGDLDEALRIRLEESLPVHQEMQDLASIAYIRFRCAGLRIGRGGFGTGEEQTIFDELAESFRLFRDLGHASFLVSVGSLFGQVLAADGQHERALTVLDEAAAAEKLQYWQRVTEIRELQEKIRGRGE
jgi:tetratricopeptide (TPR) repeat protein